MDGDHLFRVARGIAQAAFVLAIVGIGAFILLGVLPFDWAHFLHSKLVALSEGGRVFDTKLEGVLFGLNSLVLLGTLASKALLRVFEEEIAPRMFSDAARAIRSLVENQQLKGDRRTSAPKSEPFMQVALSVTYYESVLQRDLKVSAIVGFVGMIFFLVSLLKNVTIADPGLFLIVPIALLAVLLLKDQILAYRVKCGFFGTNGYEARQFLHFIISQSDNLDFSDKNGSLRKALLPELEKKSSEHSTGSADVPA